MKSMSITHLDIESDIGRRDYMEDFHLVQDVNDRFFIALVCDGHGGAKAATFLSLAFQEFGPHLFIESLNSLDIELVLTRFVDCLGPKFKDHFPQDSSGTTLCGVLVDKFEKIVTLFNLGDSQAYIYNGQKSTTDYLAKTYPHSTDDKEERQRLKDLGVPCVKDPDGTWRMFELNMSRAFGNYGGGRLDKALEKTRGRTIETQTYKITEKLTSVIVGTDGLFDIISGDKSVPLFQKTNSADLVKMANRGFKGDNVTVIKFDIKASSRRL